MRGLEIVKFAQKIHIIKHQNIRFDRYRSFSFKLCYSVVSRFSFII